MRYALEKYNNSCATDEIKSIITLVVMLPNISNNVLCATAIITYMYHFLQVPPTDTPRCTLAIVLLILIGYESSSYMSRHNIGYS